MAEKKLCVNGSMDKVKEEVGPSMLEKALPLWRKYNKPQHELQKDIADRNSYLPKSVFYALAGNIYW